MGTSLAFARARAHTHALLVLSVLGGTEAPISRLRLTRVRSGAVPPLPPKAMSTPSKLRGVLTPKAYGVYITLQEVFGSALIVTSAYRPNDSSAHSRRTALDIACNSSRYRYELVRLLLALGVTRIGVYPRHVHFDVDQIADQDVFWVGSYPTPEEDNFHA